MQDGAALLFNMDLLCESSSKVYESARASGAEHLVSDVQGGICWGNLLLDGGITDRAAAPHHLQRLQRLVRLTKGLEFRV